MIAERYLAKRYRQGFEQGFAEGRASGIAKVLNLLDDDTRKEVERKLRRNGNASHIPNDN